MAAPPEWIQTLSSHGPSLVFLGAIALVFLALKEQKTGSGFRKREADRSDLDRILNQGPDLAQAKLRPKRPPGEKPVPPAAPLALPGINLAGEPHEILGIPENADEILILKAYKEAIKRYHPDRVQGLPPEQMKFYQEVSSRLTEAKNELLKRQRST